MFERVFESIKKDKNLIFIPFLTFFVRAIIFYFIPNTYEDAFITFKYSENLANGFGLVYNIGEKVYGTTTPFFAIILAFFKYFGISCIISSLVINLISESITSLFVYKYLKNYTNELISFFITLLFVFSPSNISWSIQGMETAFFGMLIAASFFSLYKKKLFLAFLFAFLSAITRIDGLSVVFIIFLFSFIENKFSIFKFFTVPFLIFIAWLIFLQIYFGNFLPNSMLAKLILYSGHSKSMLPNLSVVLSKYFLSGYYSSALITVLFITGIYFTLKKRIKLLPMIAWFFIYYSALIISKTQIHGWYLIPPLFVFLIVSGIGIFSIYNILLKNFSRYQKLLNAFVVVFVILSSAFALKLKIEQMNFELSYEETVRIPIGKYLNKYTPISSTVFLEPIGVIGYYSNRYIYDDSALISPIFLEINRLTYNASSVYKKIELVKPDYLVLRNRDLEDFYTSTNLLKEYEKIKSFKDTVWFKENSPLSMTIFERIIKNNQAN
ncbi:MAG: hypothetical protein ROY99_09030 [Ignavibacterium sp.]|jgi:hypothetical protein|nr:hypothetical protein [Ignavibacterium sp.]